MTATQTARRERGRTRILEAAARAIAQRGYHGMSMRDLARSTGRGLASFYNYFPSKEDVLFSIQTRAFQTLIAAAEESLAGVEDARDRLYAFVLNHVRYFVEHPDVMRVLVHEASALPSSRRRVVREMKERYFSLALEIVGRLMANGGSRVKRCELLRTTYSVFGMLNWVYGWYEPARHGTPEDVARTIHRTALCGLGMQR